MVTLRCKQLSDSLAQNIKKSAIVYQFVMCDLSMQSAWNLIFLNTGMSQNHLLPSLTNYYIYVCMITFLQLTMYLTLVNVMISSNKTFTPIAIFGQFSSHPMDLFYKCYFPFTRICFGEDLGLMFTVCVWKRLMFSDMSDQATFYECFNQEVSPSALGYLP